MKTTIFLLIITLFLSCNTEPPIECNCDSSHLEYNDSIVEKFVSDTSFANRQYRHFSLEPLRNNSQESYRLKLTHSFSRYVQFYTISKSDVGAKLEVRQYYEGKDLEIKPDKKYTINLTSSQWKLIKNKVNSTCYWSNQIGKDRCQSCLDGGTWLLEGYDPDKRNCAKRENNIDACDFGDTHELGQLCVFIRKFAKEDKLDVYNDL